MSPDRPARQKVVFCEAVIAAAHKVCRRMSVPDFHPFVAVRFYGIARNMDCANCRLRCLCSRPESTPHLHGIGSPAGAGDWPPPFSIRERRYSCRRSCRTPLCGRALPHCSFVGYSLSLAVIVCSMTDLLSHWLQHRHLSYTKGLYLRRTGGRQGDSRLPPSALEARVSLARKDESSLQEQSGVF